MSLRGDDCYVDEDLRCAETLPASAFYDPAFLERELATVFRSSWQLLAPPGEDPRPLEDQLAVRGSRVPVSINGRSLFLQRGWDDDVLRAFPNTCTHAWHRLVLGASRGPTLVCPQHGRRFDCTGRFVSQPGFSDLPDFPRPCDHLTELPVATWRRMMFASFDPGASPLPTVLAELDASLIYMPLASQPVFASEREVAGNWKLHAWNYLDKFHIGFVHRAPGGLADAIDLASYKIELYDHAVLQWAWSANPDDGFDPSWLPPRFHDNAGRRVFALWWLVFPNVMLNFYPWGLSVNVLQPVPGRPEITRFGWYQWPIDADKFAQRDRRWLSAQVDAEDVDALAQVSRGLRSGYAPRGRFAPGHEEAPHWFHRHVSRAVLGT
ncbi:MAG: aromatic ring-hydroxylating dioxygenase subunit alpha [Kofleriaceae bacterium]